LEIFVDALQAAREAASSARSQEGAADDDILQVLFG
jgi:hypothetical protein